MQIRNEQGASVFVHHLLFNNRGGLDQNIFARNILVVAGIAGWHFFDLLHNVHAIAYRTKNCITLSLGSGRSVVQEIIVIDIDKKLRASRVRLISPCHCNRTFDIL